ncbi:MAG: DNA mismatch repair endonuclease MutH [Legionellales bacterium]|nr:MAG: DNA mismatch repair endonuclease MutH [Legionellales bacterium]
MSGVIYHNAPKTEAQLMARCDLLAGVTIATIAEQCNYRLPTTLLKNKGCIGQLLEIFLGATAGNLSEPDFQQLQIELKTIPLNSKHLPKESTYVCTAPNSIAALQETWHNCRVRNKLAKVLWVPIEADPKIPLADRKIGTPLLWQLDPDLEAIIRKDWEELTYMLSTGQALSLTAHHGTYLQIRPKAANSSVVTSYIDASGMATKIVPKGFYLRPSCTSAILQRQYL